jgi:hypothetical protein
LKHSALPLLEHVHAASNCHIGSSNLIVLRFNSR